MIDWEVKNHVSRKKGLGVRTGLRIIHLPSWVWLGIRDTLSIQSITSQADRLKISLQLATQGRWSQPSSNVS